MTNIFKLFLFAILLTSASTIQTQESPISNQPILESSVSKDKIAWSTDGTTLLLEAEDSGQGYAYDTLTGVLSALDQSPFTLHLTDEQVEYFQTLQSIVSKSPYNNKILYTSRVAIVCGNECNGQLIMAGDFCDTPDCYSWGFYQPIDIYGDFDVWWGSNGNAAIIRIIGSYGSFDNWYRIDFNQSNEDVFIDSLDAYADDILDISDDGNRLLYVKSISSSSLRSLIHWEIENYGVDEYQSDTLSVTATHNEKIMEGNIVGAGFSEGQYDILYIGEEGISGYSMSNGRSELLNTEINSTWVNYAVFSPDNRFVAAQVNEALYVLETNIES